MLTKEIKKLDIKTKKLINNIFLWNYKSAFKWRGLEFSDLRDYEYFDDAKMIDWLISARVGKPIIKKYKEEREINIVFLFDLSISMNFCFNKNKKDLLKEIFYLIWFSSIKNGDTISAVLFWWKKEFYIRRNKWEKSIINILNNINKYKQENKDIILDLWFLNKTKIKNSVIFLLTDKIDINEKEINILWRKNDLLYINVFDSFENNLFNRESLELLGNKNQDIVINLWDKKKIDNYKKLRFNKIKKLELALNRKKIDYLYIDETLDIYKEFVSLMNKRINKR